MKMNKIYIVVAQKREGKIVFLLNSNDSTIPKTPKGYKKIRGNKPQLCAYVTKKQHTRLKSFYDKVIDLR